MPMRPVQAPGATWIMRGLGMGQWNEDILAHEHLNRMHGKCWSRNLEYVRRKPHRMNHICNCRGTCPRCINTGWPGYGGVGSHGAGVDGGVSPYTPVQAMQQIAMVQSDNQWLYGMAEQQHNRLNHEERERQREDRRLGERIRKLEREHRRELRHRSHSRHRHRRRSASSSRSFSRDGYLSDSESSDFDEKLSRLHRHGGRNRDRHGNPFNGGGYGGYMPNDGGFGNGGGMGGGFGPGGEMGGRRFNGGGGW
ncbi:MAG: hypothetical protein Q9217_002109 [Psora testacea]